jgi:anti-sigma factor RsiW
MNPSEIPNIDELLNSFIDGELDQRHQTEVQRLIKHDERIAERLLTLQKCKRLVSSLPYTEAPQELLGNIKASLEEKKLPVSAVRPSASPTLGLAERRGGERDYAESEQPVSDRQQRRERRGARHLLLRRLTAAAAMIGLVAVLAALIYSIIASDVTTTDKPVAVERKPAAAQPREVAAVEKPIHRKVSPSGGQTTLAEMKFSGRLELKTSSPSEVAAFINKAIEYNIPSDERTAAVPGKLRESHALICSRQNLKLLLDDLDTIWDKIDSATLFVQTNRPEGQIAIDAVAPEQIIEIAKQDDFETQIKTAKYFAAMNNMAERSPGKEVMVAIDNSAPGLITIPKPVLTSSEKPITKTAGGIKVEQKVLLTIVVVGSE